MAIFADHLLVPSRTDCFTAVMWPVCASSSTPKTDLNSDETFFHMSCANGLDLVLPVLHSILIAISPPVLFLPSFPRDTRFFNPSLPLFLPLSFSPSLSLSIFLFSPSVFFKRFSSSVTCNEQLHRRIVHRVKGKWANFFPRLISLFSPSLFWIFLLNFISSCFFFWWWTMRIYFILCNWKFFYFLQFLLFFFFLLHYLLNIARYTWRFPFHTMIFRSDSFFLRVWFIRKRSNISVTFPKFINPQCQSNFTNEYFSWKWNIFGEHFGPLVINAIDQSVNEVVDCSMAP